MARSVKRISEKISETDLWVDGGFYSESDLADKFGLNALLDYTNCYC